MAQREDSPMARALLVSASLLALLATPLERSARAACAEPPGDLNGDGGANVADALCSVLVNLWSLAGELSAPPACLQSGFEPRVAADANCDSVLNVVDAQITVQLALGIALSPLVDDGDGCPDACDLDLDGDGDADWLDCAPSDPQIHSAAAEACNGLDDDCNALADDPDPGAPGMDCDDSDPCNGLEACAVPSPGTGLVISEVMVDPAAVSDALGQWVELANPTDAPINVRGYRLAVGGSSFTVDPGGALWAAPRGAVVVGRSALPALNGGVKVHAELSALSLPSAGTLELRRPNDTLADAVIWGTAGAPSVVAGRSLARSPAGALVASTVALPSGDFGTPGGPNRDLLDGMCSTGTCPPGGCADPSCNAPDPDVVFETRNHFNGARLDDQHLALAWGTGADLNAPQTGFYVQIWQRAGGSWNKGTPLWVNHPLLAVGMTTSIANMGAVGPQHFFIIAEFQQGANWSRNLLWFKRNGLDATLLSTTNMGLAAFFQGHPIDSNRFLLRYRYNNSGQPVFYRVLRRNGDSYTLAPELQRPQPNAFPSGAASQEPQTYDAIARTGTNTFREIRGGYVWAFSRLSSYAITVNANDTLSMTSLLTHNASGDKAMNPIAAANGTGGVAISYFSYPSGVRTASLNGTSYTDHGQVLAGPGPTIHNSCYESTDGFYGGKYWLRQQSGHLFKFTGLAAAPSIVMSDLTSAYCYNVPSVLRMGSEAIFLVCGPDQPLRVRALSLDAL
jgi:hypothetical protein